MTKLALTEGNLMMKKRLTSTYIILMFLTFCFYISGHAQEDLVSVIIKEKVNTLIKTGKLKVADDYIVSKHILSELYQRNDFRALWENPQNVNDLLEEIEGVAEDGLNPEDYHLSKLIGLKSRIENGESSNPTLLAEYDILLTDSLTILDYHLLFGKVDPEKLHPTWNMSREIKKDPVGAIDKRLQTGTLATGLKNIRPQHEGYHRLKAALKKYRRIQASGGWQKLPQGPALKPGMIDDRVPLLRRRLNITGDFEGMLTDSERYDEVLEAAVIRFQNRHRLTADGVVGKKTLAALNIPVEQKIDQIRANLERARWVFHKLPADFIVADIAGFRVNFLQDKKIAWSTKAQVGKPYRNTPVFKSKIKYLVINPTWTIPPTILQKDILPKIRKNPDYLRKMKIRVLDKSGKRIDPRVVDWSKYSAKNLPYILRQDPGPHNALGRIKFIFPNKYFIYLHDTPSQSLFDHKNRAFSSGCIRVEKYIELAELVLGNPDKWNQQSIQALIATNRTQRVNLPKPMPVVLFYRTVRVDENGNIVFKKDVYKRDNAIIDALNNEFKFWQERAFE
jgi:murein L,D-transpeptidase YcbB/YkuD